MGLAALGLVGSVASTGLSIYGQNSQAKAQQQAAAYNNALAAAEAKNLEAQTMEGIARQRRRNRSSLSELRARLAAGGTQSTTGAPLLLMGESAARMETSIADAARSTAMQAASLRAKGRMGLWEADTMAAATRTNMLATAVGGAASAFGQYQQGKYYGTF